VDRSLSSMKIKRLLREYALATYFGAEERPGRMLPMAIRIARARLKHGIGPRPFSMFDLSRVPESDWAEYSTKSDSDAVLRSINPEDMHQFARNKILFHEHCRRVGLPTIPVICRIGGTPDPVGNDVELATDAGRLLSLLGPATHFFAKPIAGSYGAGAFVIVRQGANFQFDGRDGDAADLFAYIFRKCDPRTGYIIQPQMRPHASMASLASSNGLPTVRVVTAMSPHGPEALFACLRIPVGASITDNFNHGTGGNLTAAIDLSSGTLAPARGSRRSDWPVMMNVDSHPDTGFRITGSQLPFWPEIMEAALRGQASLTRFKTIGWDIASTPEGVVLVEANSTYDMDILQVTHGRGLKAEWTSKLRLANA
jgi:hypothetical protein